MERVGEVVRVPYGRSGSQLAVIVAPGSRSSRVTVDKFRHASGTWSRAVEVPVSKVQPLTCEDRAFFGSYTRRDRLPSFADPLPMDLRAKMLAWFKAAP